MNHPCEMLAKCIHLWQLSLLPPKGRIRKLQNVSYESKEISYSHHSARSCLKGNCRGNFWNFWNFWWVIEANWQELSALPLLPSKQPYCTCFIHCISHRYWFEMQGKILKDFKLDQKISGRLQWKTRRHLTHPLNYLVYGGFGHFLTCELFYNSVNYR